MNLKRIFWPWGVIREQDKQIEQLHDDVARLIAGSLTVADAKVIGNNAYVKLAGGPLGVLADVFVDHFQESKAVNYLSMDFEHAATGERYTVCMQKLSGMTPGERAARIAAEARLLITSTNQEEAEQAVGNIELLLEGKRP